jgi:hypothetical protein
MAGAENALILGRRESIVFAHGSYVFKIGSIISLFFFFPFFLVAGRKKRGGLWEVDAIPYFSQMANSFLAAPAGIV